MAVVPVYSALPLPCGGRPEFPSGLLGGAGDEYPSSPAVIPPGDPSSCLCLSDTSAKVVNVGKEFCEFGWGREKKPH